MRSLFDGYFTSEQYSEYKDRLGPWYSKFSKQDYENLELILNKVDLDRETRTVYPSDDLIFRVYKETAPRDVRVVIVGQDPYYTSGQAVGRAFACGSYESPSLRVIRSAFDQERIDEFGLNDFDITLQHWVDQGVFLLNTALTVISSKPGSHSGIGWDKWINATIDILNENKLVIWLLWGAEAKGLISKINSKHRILIADHPMYAQRMGMAWNCDHFAMVNKIFKQRRLNQIEWTMTK